MYTSLSSYYVLRRGLRASASDNYEEEVMVRVMMIYGNFPRRETSS